MKTRWFLRGLGIGIIISALFLCIGYREQSDHNELIKEAKKIGMVFPKEETTSVELAENLNNIQKQEVVSEAAVTTTAETEQEKNSREKIEKSKLFQNPQTIRYILFILFFIPGTPKDLLTYIAALLPIKPTEFILISTLARFPSVISSTLAGASLLKGNWKLSLIIYGVTFAIVAVVVLIMRKLDKNKITDEAIRTIQ